MAMAIGDVRETGNWLTFHLLTPEGPAEECNVASADFYVSNQQISWLWDPAVIKQIKEQYGSVVGIIHDVHPDISLPAYPTFKCILG